MLLPNRPEAERLLDEAGSLNPGGWIAHSRNVGDAAARIAVETGLDPDAARVMGMLHDIGRRFGKSRFRHVITGYRYLTDLGYDDAARLSLSHSFMLPDLGIFGDGLDGTPEEIDYVRKWLAVAEFDDYDRLIQFCDILALPEGFCLLEKRMVDAAMRLGVTPLSPRKWRAIFDLKDYFERRMGRSVYSLLPGVAQTTFGGEFL
jgi:putative nucleotidyltransferase with HDIG domain